MIRTHVHGTGTPRLLRGDGTRKGPTGGSEGAIEATKDICLDIPALTDSHGWCADKSAIYSEEPQNQSLAMYQDWKSK